MPAQIYPAHSPSAGASSVSSKYSGEGIECATVADGKTVAVLPFSPQPTPNSEDLIVATASSEKEGWVDWKSVELPEKTQARLLRNLRFQLLTVYHRLFSVVFSVNLAVFIATLVQGTTAAHVAKIVVANLTIAILIRQDYIINALFETFCFVPQSWPLSIRLLAARIFHLGGAHSGSGIAGVMWLGYFTGLATKELADGGKASVPTVAITYVILVLLLFIVALAYPAFRVVQHDTFERTHRFLGWTAVALVWAQIICLTNDYKIEGETLGQALVRSPPLWMVVAITVSLIIPWLHLRKYDIETEVLSDHAVQFYFNYGPGPTPGSFTRVSVNPLFEWHSFATMAVPGKPGYSIIISRVGDWTSSMIASPPKQIWVRGIPTCGVMRIVPLFRRVVLVATGSGIAPCAPAILAKKAGAMRVLWTAPNVRKTFGDKLVDTLLEANPEMVLYDTRSYGKPDMVKLVYKLACEFDAEAVVIISNQKLTRQVVYGMMSRGIPAFGAIWDS